LLSGEKSSFEIGYLGDKSWTKIPVLQVAGRVMPGGKKIS
jgi:hypothetical protein